MFSKKIIWLAVLSVYPLCAEPSPAKTSAKAHDKSLGTEYFVPAQDEPFSSPLADKKATKSGDDSRAIDPDVGKVEIVKAATQYKSIPGEAEKIQTFLSPAPVPVVTTVSAVLPVSSTRKIQETEVVKTVQVQPVQAVAALGRTDQAGMVSSPAAKTVGPLRVIAKPTLQELQDREQYWLRRGRSDLAAGVRDQIKALQPGKETVMAVAVPPVKVLTCAVESTVKAEVPMVQKPDLQAGPQSALSEVKLVPVKTVEPTSKEITAPVVVQAKVSTPIAAPTHVSVPTPVLVPLPDRLPAPAPVPSAVIAPTVRPVDKTPSKAAVIVKQEEIYRDASVVIEPGVKQAKTDLDERNRYWDAHGRSDLVTQTAKSPMQGVKKSVEPVSREVKSAAAESSQKKNALNSQADSPENVSDYVSANPTRQELDERAKYWAARGRTDLSAKVQNQIVEPKPVAAVRPVVTPIAPVRPAVAAPVVERVRSVTRTISGEAETASPELAKPTSQELDDGAQYWEARGRADLASQLRLKLQAMEPRHTAVVPNVMPIPVQDFEKNENNHSVAKNALEDALLKNPGSIQARLDLAQIYQGAGEFNKARGLIDGVLAGSPDLPAALYSSAQLYAEQRLWRETLFTLEKISPVSRRDEMGKLQKTAWAHVQIDRADALVRQGNNREAEVLLREVAVELAVNENQSAQPQTPTLWKSVTQKKTKH
jgi:tetratricopeptide (TPR) repeat protein